jgi:hypothetical protein
MSDETNITPEVKPDEIVVGRQARIDAIEAGAKALNDAVNEDGMPKKVMAQRVVLVFADGRQGVFIGPALIHELELANPPRLVKVDLLKPFELEQENPNGKENATSAAGSGDTENLAVVPAEGGVPQS